MKRINEIYRIRRRLKACRHAVTADIAAASRLKNAAYAEVMSYAETRYVPSAVWRKFDAASENLRLALGIRASARP